jgi:hypothetical protein
VASDVGGRILSTIVVFGAIVTIITIIAKVLTDLDACYDRGGVLVNTFFGYDCVLPLRKPP